MKVILKESQVNTLLIDLIVKTSKDNISIVKKWLQDCNFIFLEHNTDLDNIEFKLSTKQYDFKYLNQILKFVKDCYQVKNFNLIENTEKIKLKQIAHSLAREFTNYSLRTIGLEIGNKEHATILNSIKRVSNYCDTEKIYMLEYEQMYNVIANQLHKKPYIRPLKFT